MDDTQFEYIRQLVHSHVAIVLDRGKDYLVQTRLAPIARSNGMGTVEDLLSYMQQSPWSPLHKQVLEAMTTNETMFFRDRGPFELLRRKVIPDLLTARAAEKSLTIWSAACSSGQEIYSIAMLLREHFSQLASWRVTLLATDYSHEMVERTRRGVFSQLEVNRGLPAPLLVRYFQRNGTEWQITPELRNMVVARQMNLTDAWAGIGGVDVLLLRNVLIYFDTETKRRILERARRALAPGGHLFLGAAETTLGLHDGFQMVELDRSLAYRPRVPN